MSPTHTPTWSASLAHACTTAAARRISPSAAEAMRACARTVCMGAILALFVLDPVALAFTLTGILLTSLIHQHTQPNATFSRRAVEACLWAGPLLCLAAILWLLSDNIYGWQAAAILVIWAMAALIDHAAGQVRSPQEEAASATPSQDASTPTAGPQPTAFPTKTYACQWQVVVQPVDQYGKSQGAPTVLSRWAHREDAVADLPTHGAQNPHTGSWHPHGGSAYEDLKVIYREVLIAHDTPTADPPHEGKTPLSKGR